MESGGVGLFVSAPDLLKKIQATYQRNTTVSEQDLMETIYTVPWLVLDDLGVEKPSPFVVQEFYLIVEKRRMAGLWTVITSNLSTAQLAKHWRQRDTAPGDFDPAVRVIERIREYCLGLEVNGRNQRQGRA
jgi:DNA replication protein DnaC